MNTKKYIIIGVAVFASLLLILSILFVVRTRKVDPPYTGGSGEAPRGHLILTGYETKSADSSHIPLGTFLTIDQEEKIRIGLETVLYQKSPQATYVATIDPESFTVDYRESVLQFKVLVEKPPLTYTIKYDTVTDEMNILDEKGQVVRSSTE